MFSKIFSRGKGIFTRKILPIFFGFCFVMGTALFSGCSMGNDSSNIIGTWVSNFDEKWVITPTTVTSYGYDGEPAYVGTIRNTPDFAAPAGVIIIEYTVKPQYYDYDSSYSVTGGPYDPPGNFYAIYWKELTATSIDLANAWSLTDFSHNGAPEKTTLSDAVAEFTLDNAGNYVSMYSSCERR